jgi:multiple sugar transport system ATP-binding protein
MDEPLSNLDAKLRVQMRADIAALQSRLRVTTVYVTPDQAEAMTLGHRVAVLHEGLLQQCDTPRALYERPANTFVAGFIGSPSMNFFSATLDGDRVRLPIGEAKLPDELRRAVESRGGGSREVIGGLRPEDFEDAELVDRSRHEGGLEFDANIELVESMGSEIYAYFTHEGEGARSDQISELAADAGTADLHGGEAQQVVARLNADSQVARGQPARLWLDTSKLHLFEPESGENLTRREAAPAAA